MNELFLKLISEKILEIIMAGNAHYRYPFNSLVEFGVEIEGKIMIMHLPLPFFNEGKERQAFILSLPVSEKTRGSDFFTCPICGKKSFYTLKDCECIKENPEKSEERKKHQALKESIKQELLAKIDAGEELNIINPQIILADLDDNEGWNIPEIKEIDILENVEKFNLRVYSKNSVVEKKVGFSTQRYCPECITLFPSGMRECSCGWNGVASESFCPQCGKDLPRHWSPKCDCGWSEYTENTFVFVSHWPDGSVSFHDESLDVLSTLTMPKNEIVLGVLERLGFTIYFKKNGEVEVIESYQDGEGKLNSEVKYQGKKLGSHRAYDADDTWTVGDGSASYLILRDEKIILCRRRYSERDTHWSEEPTEEVICDVKDIIKMTFFTTSGWCGECYPVRTSEESLELPWGTIWFRSSGGVTLTDFPFEIKALRPEPDWMKETPEVTVPPEYENDDSEPDEEYEVSELVYVEGSDEVRRQVNGVWQHKHESYDYWHPMARVHKEERDAIATENSSNMIEI